MCICVCVYMCICIRICIDKLNENSIRITIRTVELLEGTWIYMGMLESTVFGYVWEILDWFQTQQLTIYICRRFVPKRIIKTHRFLEQAKIIKNQWFAISLTKVRKNFTAFSTAKLDHFIARYIWVNNDLKATSLELLQREINPK